MIFYLIPATADQAERIETTQDAARTECKARGLKPSAFTQHNVPTDKAGLQAYVNDLLTRNIAAKAPAAPQEAISDDRGPAPAPAPVAAPAAAPAPIFTRPAALTRDSICEAISDLGGVDLGFVALEVSARFDAIAAKAKALAA